MKAPLSWIKEFTPIEGSVDMLVAALNQLGLEVEGIEEPGRGIQGVIVAKVLDVVPHPQADKLSLVDIEHGSGQTRVVCGAPNVVAGMVVPFAPAGATIAGGITLERRKIRGVVSDGMLCAPDELGLGADHGGILALDGNAELGAEVREVLGLDDVVFDLSITPNRPDAMCIVGVARELAAHFRWPFEVPVPNVVTDSGVALDVTVSIEAPDRCPRYVARVAHVTLGPSPAWMQQRLVKAGMRPISNVVDVTNYVLMERNQPLHAFDLTRLSGRGVVVRSAEAEERIVTLDDVDRELSAEDLLICDAQRAPQAIAGIMGGSTSEVAEGTTEILLEAAYFERMGIARSSKRLKLRSESSARFERGLDPDAVAQHADRALELLVEVAAARVAPGAVDAYPQPVVRPSIVLRTTKVNRVLGTTLSSTEIVDALRPLGNDISNDVDNDNEGAGDELQVRPPTFRPDLEREIDLVEEVARRIGFAAIGRTVPKPEGQIGALTPHQRDRRLVADVLVGVGCSEAITIPLVAPADLEHAGLISEMVVETANPLRAEESVLRPVLLPGLLRVVATNQARGLVDVALFEMGRVFRAPEDDSVLPSEYGHVAAVWVGQVHRSPVEPSRAVDAYDAVETLRAIVAALELAEVRFETVEHPGFHQSRAMTVSVDGATVGIVGELSEVGLESFGVSAPAVGFEVCLDNMLAATRRDRGFRTPSPYPPSAIDLAFVVDELVLAAEIEATLRRVVGESLEEVRCFDEFRADSLGAGRKSVAFSLRFRVPDRTLTDDEITQLRQQVINAVATAHGGALRA